MYQGVKVARFQLGPHILLQRCYTKMASDRDFDPEHISQAGGDVGCFERDARVRPELLARGLRTAAENGSPVFPARAGWSIGSAGCCRWELSPSYSFHLHWHGDPGEQSCSACLIASLPHCLIASLPHWLSAAHCARSDNRSTTRRTTCEPLPSPSGNSRPFVSRETGSMVVAPSPRSPSQIGIGCLLDGDHDPMASGVPSSARTPT